MASRIQSTRFLLGTLLALLVVLCIYQGQRAHHELREVSIFKRSVLSSVTYSDSHNSSSLARFEKRKAATWEEAVQTGKGLICRLKQLDVNQNLHSQWTDLDSLNPYWSSHSYGSQGDSTTTGTDISEALASLGLPSTLGDRGLMGMNYVQDREWTEDGKNYDATYGYYIGSMSATSGYISAENNASPWEESDKERQPPLTKLSDVYFLSWQDIASRKQLRNLKYFFRLHVINTQSKAITAQAFGGEPVPRWPGRSFDLSTDEGLAILGTPNGAGVAWFLINHKPELGVRAPNKVTVFSTLAQDAYGQPEDWIHFLFYIAPVSNPST